MSGPDGKPIQRQEEGTLWFEYCTLEEKEMIHEIMLKAKERMEQLNPRIDGSGEDPRGI